MTHRSLPHTADIRIAFETATFTELLQEGLLVMRQLLAGDAPVVPRESRPVSLATGDPAEAFLGFLRDLLYLAATNGFVPAAFTAAGADEFPVSGTLLGEPFDPARHAPQPEVKAVTRHGLVVERRDGGWYAEVVFDV
jgi:SHS2 domain-containing protein